MKESVTTRDEILILVEVLSDEILPTLLTLLSTVEPLDCCKFPSDEALCLDSKILLASTS